MDSIYFFGPDAVLARMLCSLLPFGGWGWGGGRGAERRNWGGGRGCAETVRFIL